MAFATDTFVLINIKQDFFHGKMTELIFVGGFLLAGMFLDGNEFFLGRIRISLFSLGLVEEVQLTFDIVIPFFAGFAKEFLGKEVDLFLEDLFAFDVFFFAFVGNFEQGIKVLNSNVQFLDGILKFYKLTIP